MPGLPWKKNFLGKSGKNAIGGISRLPTRTFYDGEYTVLAGITNE